MGTLYCAWVMGKRVGFHDLKKAKAYVEKEMGRGTWKAHNDRWVYNAEKVLVNIYIVEVVE